MQIDPPEVVVILLLVLIAIPWPAPAVALEVPSNVMVPVVVEIAAATVIPTEPDAVPVFPVKLIAPVAAVIAAFTVSPVPALAVIVIALPEKEPTDVLLTAALTVIEESAVKVSVFVALQLNKPLIVIVPGSPKGPPPEVVDVLMTTLFEASAVCRSPVAITTGVAVEVHTPAEKDPFVEGPVV